MDAVEGLEDAHHVLRPLLVSLLVDTVVVEHRGFGLIGDAKALLDDRPPPDLILDIRRLLIKWEAVPDVAAEHAICIVEKGILDLDAMVEPEGEHQVALIQVRRKGHWELPTIHAGDALDIHVLAQVPKPVWVARNAVCRQADKESAARGSDAVINCLTGPELFDLKDLHLVLRGDSQGVVGAIVVNEYDLKVLERLSLDGAQAAADPALLVLCTDNDRDFRVF